MGLLLLSAFPSLCLWISFGSRDEVILFDAMTVGSSVRRSVASVPNHFASFCFFELFGVLGATNVVYTALLRRI